MLGRKEYALGSGLGIVIPVSFMFYRFPLHGHMSYTRIGDKEVLSLVSVLFLYFLITQPFRSLARLRPAEFFRLHL